MRCILFQSGMTQNATVINMTKFLMLYLRTILILPIASKKTLFDEGPDMSERNDATEQHIDSNLHTTIRCPFTCSGIKLCKKKNRRLYQMPLGVNWQSILQVNTLNFGFVFTVQQSSANDSVRFKAKLVYKNHYFANTSSCVPSVVTCIYNRQIYSKIFFFFL